MAEKADSDGFEKEWEKALSSGEPVKNLIEALVIFREKESELSLLIAETAAERLDSEDPEKAFEFSSEAAELFNRSDTSAFILAEALRDRYLMYEPLESFISASGLLGGKVPLHLAWRKLRELLRYTQGSFILHNEFGPGEILRVSRSSFTVDFQRARDHDITISALLDSTRPVYPESLYVLRWRNPEKFEKMIDHGGESLLKRAFNDLSVDDRLTEVNLFKLLESSGTIPRTMWKALKKAAEDSQGFILMGDSVIPADNTSLTAQVKAVLATGKLPLSLKTKTITALIKAAPGGKAKELTSLFSDVVKISDIEKGAVFELAWLCSNRGRSEDFEELTAHLIEDIAVRMERALGEIHSTTCRKLYLQRFFQSSPAEAEVIILLDRLPRILREQAADNVVLIDPELHERYLLKVLDDPGETEHFMWALERAANLGSYMEPHRIVSLGLKNLNFAKAEMQRRICNLLMDSLRPQLEQHISLLDTRRLEALDSNLEESIGAQESGLVLLARRELSGRRTGGFTNIKKYWEDDAIYSSRDGIARRMEEMEDIQAERIPAAAREIAEAASHGDLSENAEYTAALEKRDFLLETLNRYRKEFKLLRPYPVGQVTAEMICPATKVVLEPMDGDVDMKTVSIVGPLDSNSENGFINYKAPLGAALLGLTKGDTVQLPGDRERSWRVTFIEVLEEYL